MKSIIYYVLYLSLIMSPFNVFSMSEIDEPNYIDELIYTKPTIAFYSEEQANKGGTYLYIDETGNEFEVSEVSSIRNRSNFDDAVILPTEGRLTFVKKLREKPNGVYKDKLGD